jgi:hypothetical protein
MLYCYNVGAMEQTLALDCYPCPRGYGAISLSSSWLACEFTTKNSERPLWPSASSLSRSGVGGLSRSSLQLYSGGCGGPSLGVSLMGGGGGSSSGSGIVRQESDDSDDESGDDDSKVDGRESDSTTHATYQEAHELLSFFIFILYLYIFLSITALLISLHQKKKKKKSLFIMHY